MSLACVLLHGSFKQFFLCFVEKTWENGTATCAFGKNILDSIEKNLVCRSCRKTRRALFFLLQKRGIKEATADWRYIFEYRGEKTSTMAREEEGHRPRKDTMSQEVAAAAHIARFRSLKKLCHGMLEGKNSMVPRSPFLLACWLC